MEKIKAAVIGAGNWGEVHALAYARHPGVELAAICDLDRARAEALAEKYGAAEALADYREVMARDEITAVSVATPDITHTDIAVAAAAAGKHVLVEKPLATTMEDCRRTIEAAEKSGIKLMVDFHNRWNPAFVKAREAIASGELGQLSLIHVRLNDTIYVPTKMLSWADRSSVLWFLGSHCFDLVLWLTGDQVKRVTAYERSRILKDRGLDTPDFYVTVLELKSGAVAVVENCWVIAETAPMIFDFKCEIVGSRGTMFIDPSHNRTVQKYTESEGGYEDVLGGTVVHGKPVGFIYLSVQHFVECLENDQQPMVGGEDGMRVTRLVLAAIESASTTRPLDIGE